MQPPDRTGFSLGSLPAVRPRRLTRRELLLNRTQPPAQTGLEEEEAVNYAAAAAGLGAVVAGAVAEQARQIYRYGYEFEPLEGRIARGMYPVGGDLALARDPGPLEMV